MKGLDSRSNLTYYVPALRVRVVLIHSANRAVLFFTDQATQGLNSQFRSLRYVASLVIPPVKIDSPVATPPGAFEPWQGPILFLYCSLVPYHSMKASIIGLLGGIGSGKSRVAALLAERGAAVLDADRYAGELLDDPAVRREIRAHFGDRVFLAGGDLDRPRLAERVFNSDEDRARINAIIHPRVRVRFRERIAEIRAAEPDRIIVLDIPLLLGSELRAFCDRLVMVSASREVRLERVMRTRGWDADELDRREACQPSLREKEEAADGIIENNGTLNDLETQVEAFLESLKT